MNQSIINCLLKHRQSTTIILEQYLTDDGFNVFGSSGIYLPGNMNVMVWGGISDELQSIMASLIRTQQVKMLPANPLVYLMKMPLFPICYDFPQKRYSNLHWMPVYFELVNIEQPTEGVITKNDIRERMF